MKQHKVQLLFRVSIYGSDWLMSAEEYELFINGEDIIPNPIKPTYVNDIVKKLDPKIKEKVLSDMKRRKW